MMKRTKYIKKLDELFPVATINSNIRNKINCLYFDSDDIAAQFSMEVFLNASTIILVLSGTGTVHINYTSYSIEKNMTILLSASHLFSFDECSDDFRCVCLFVSKDFMEEMDSTDMIYKRIRYGVKMYNDPVLRLSGMNTSLLFDRISTIERAIDNSDHLYYKDVILNNLFAFYLDLSNIIDRQADSYKNENITRYESIIKSFIELLIDNYRQEHKVDFYASKLNISAHYLTLIVKRITGESVCDFIFEMLYSDARTLLSNSKLSIQEISAILNFSDQSSFGKFFKRKSDVSPIDYRKMKN